MDFTKQEERLLVRSGDLALIKRMKKSSIVITLCFAVLMTGAAIASKNLWVLLAISLAYLFVTLCEKIAYVNTAAAYKSLVVKLSTRINELEKKG